MIGVVDIGNTRTKCALFDEKGGLRAESAFPTTKGLPMGVSQYLGLAPWASVSRSREESAALAMVIGNRGNGCHYGATGQHPMRRISPYLQRCSRATIAGPLIFCKPDIACVSIPATHRGKYLGDGL